MSQTHIRLFETAPPGTIECVVRADEHDRRSWLRHAPVCAALARRRITHVGVARAVYPYSVTRARLTGMFVMACVNGAGEVLLHNRWRPVKKGQATAPALKLMM